MPLSEVDICNRALAQLGIARIMALTEDSDQARACNELYAHSRDSVLVDGKWNFALRRKQLVKSATAPLFDFDNAYPLPADCLLVRKVKDDDIHPWQVEDNELLTDNDVAKIQYTARVKDPASYSIMFVDALVARLAAELSEPLKAIRTKNADFWNIYTTKLQGNRTIDGFEGTPEEDDANILGEVRSGVGRWPTWWG